MSWIDMAQEVDHDLDPRSDDEDTVYDKSRDSGFRRNPFAEDPSRPMLDEVDTRCGIFNWRPQFLQNCATHMNFTAIFILCGILHGASYTYFNACISTMEKRLKISSETTGALLAGNEIAQVIVYFVLTYFSIRTKRIKFIAMGASLWAASCFLLASHQMFFGSGDYALSLIKYENGFGTINTGTMDSNFPNMENETFPYFHDRAMPSSQFCIRDVEVVNKTMESCSIGDSGSSLPISFVLMSQILAGAGTMLFLSSGCPYSEEIVIPDQLPFLLAVTLSLRLIGGFGGFVFGHYFLRLFISTVSRPIITEYDPRWMGAWWMGWLTLGLFMAIFALFISFFPGQTPREVLKKRSLTTDTGQLFINFSPIAALMSSAELKIANDLPTTRNFMKTLFLFFNNDINVFATISTIFHVFASIGYWTFFPKYLEVVFHQAASKAAVITGCVTVTFNATGILVGGMFLSRVLPHSEKVSFWNCMVTIFQVLTLALITQFGCDTGNIVIESFNPSSSAYSTFAPLMTTPSSGISSFETSSQSNFQNISDVTLLDVFTTTTTTITNSNSKLMVHILSNCSAGCNCKLGPMIPVCDQSTGRVFYSPCHAGCEPVNYDHANGTVFSGCSCVAETSKLTKGFCSDSGCFAGMVTALVFTAFSQFLEGSAVVGKLLIFYRAIVPEDRNLIISLGVLLVVVFAIIPGPIIAGAIIDSACHIWENTCDGRQGHCWHYNNTILRYGFNMVAAGFLVCAAVFDVLLWRKVKVKDVRLYDGDITQIPKPVERPFDEFSSGTRDDRNSSSIS